MIRTEDDLRQALDAEPDGLALARLSTFVDALDGQRSTLEFPAGQRLARRRWAPLVAAAAVILTVSGAALVAVERQRSRSSADTAAAEGVLSPAQLRPTWDIAAEAIPGYTSTGVSTTSQGRLAGSVVDIQATSRTRPESGLVISAGCAGGLANCTKPPVGVTAEKVSVAGRTAYFYPGRHVDQSGLRDSLYRQPWVAAANLVDVQPQLMWNAGNGTVVRVTGTFGFAPATYSYDNTAAKKVMLRIADSVTAGRHDPVFMPFALTALPGPVAPEAVRLARGLRCIGYGTGQGPYPGEWVGSVLTACRVTTGSTRRSTIAAAEITPSETAGVWVHNFADGTSVVVELDQGKQNLVSIAQGQQLADTANVTPTPADRSTWLEVR
jgi:hypothetical protein